MSYRKLRKLTFLSGILFFLTSAFSACGEKTQTQAPVEQFPIAAEEACLYRLPWPSSKGEYRVSQGISDETNESHKPGELEEFAIDFALPEGTPVLATRDGVVSAVHHGETLFGGPDKAEYANFVVIEHDGGVFSTYWHLQPGIPVKKGQTVVQGQHIGDSGRTGWTYGRAHLHYQLQERGGKFGQSIPLCFAEVEGGVPQLDKTYASQNQRVPASVVLGPGDDEIPEISGEVSGVATAEPEPEPIPNLNRKDKGSILTRIKLFLENGDVKILSELANSGYITYGGLASYSLPPVGKNQEKLTIDEAGQILMASRIDKTGCLYHSENGGTYWGVLTGPWKDLPNDPEGNKIIFNFQRQEDGFYLANLLIWVIGPEELPAWPEGTFIHSAEPGTLYFENIKSCQK